VRENDKASDPVVLARAVHRALVARRPRAAYGVREDRGRALLDRLPTRVSDRVLQRVMTPPGGGEGRTFDVEWT
jgi:hypothetical protein